MTADRQNKNRNTNKKGTLKKHGRDTMDRKNYEKWQNKKIKSMEILKNQTEKKTE